MRDEGREDGETGYYTVQYVGNDLRTSLLEGRRALLSASSPGAQAAAFSLALRNLFLLLPRVRVRGKVASDPLLGDRPLNQTCMTMNSLRATLNSYFLSSAILLDVTRLYSWPQPPGNETKF